jgi:cell division cycle 20-like protein 1 (cofactor of APC complex)
MNPLYMLQVSTYGNLQNQILVWKYPSLIQLGSLIGHSSGVLYMAVSPNGETIVTGAGDKTLRFWNMFSKASSQKVSAQFVHWGNIFF